MLEWLFGKKKQQDKKEQKKVKRQKSQQEKQDKWMYQFLVQFLSSPIWRVSILDFVDNNCLIFDNQQENKFQYTVVHNKFKQLVGTLFDGMMSQIGLNDQKLVQLLQYGFQSKQKKLFAQLLLCDDFLKFKQLMLKRNKTLQQEAIRALKGQSNVKGRNSKYQIQKNQLKQAKKQSQLRKKRQQQEQQAMLRKVLQMSMRQAQERQAMIKLEKAAEQHQLKQSQLASSHTQQNKSRQYQHPVHEQKQKNVQWDQQQRLRAEQNQKKQRLRAKMKKQKQNQNQDIHHKPTLPPVKAKPQIADPFNWDAPKQQVKQQIKHIQQPIIKQQLIKQEKHQQQQKQQQHQQSAQNIESQQQRKRRLLQQRQKIRRKKQQQRKKMLQESQIGNKKQTVSIVLQDDGIHDTHVGQKHIQEKQDKIAKQEIQRRKELMKKIKNRIVDDF